MTECNAFECVIANGEIKSYTLPSMKLSINSLHGY
jgi:hypothetical protein